MSANAHYRHQQNQVRMLLISRLIPRADRIIQQSKHRVEIAKSNLAKDVWLIAIFIRNLSQFVIINIDLISSKYRMFDPKGWYCISLIDPLMEVGTGLLILLIVKPGRQVNC